MGLQAIIGTEVFRWVILPLLIFCARIFDVSIGTLRIIYVTRSMKLLAMVCGFFEVLIWLTAITQIMQHLSNFVMYITYAGGFAVGNYIGILIENKLAVGFVALRIITQKDATELVEHLKERDYGITTEAAYGLSGNVQLVFTIVRRKELKEVIDVIKNFNPGAYFSIEDVREVSNGTFTLPEKRKMDVHRTIKKMK
jgi:uncharacterized protein YebE (UPF0316 family)